MTKAPKNIGSRSSKIPIVVGMSALMLFVGSFAAWSGMADLSSAVVVGGTVQTDAPKYMVQSLKGGTVQELRINNNDRVKKGQLLMEFNVTAEKINLLSGYQSLISLRAEKEKLNSLLRQKEELNFSSNLSKMAREHQGEDMLNLEMRRFKTDLKQNYDSLELLTSKIASLKSIIPNMRSQVNGRAAEKKLIEERLKAIKSLVDSGHTSINELRNIKLLVANKNSQLADAQSRLNLRRQELESAILQKPAIDSKRKNELIKRIADIGRSETGLIAQIKEYEDIIKNASVYAIVDGQVTDMQIASAGQVVGSGGKLLDIIADSPVNSIKVQIKPDDIDRVWIGQSADIVLSAFPQRNMSKITGIVQSVSADTIVTKSTGLSTYEAVIKLDKMSIKDAERSYGSALNLTPGMLVQVFIIDGKNTLLGYLFDPYALTFQKAFSGN